MNRTGQIVFGLALVLFFLFVAVSLASYSPGDPPGISCYPTAATIHNLCRGPGALCAWALVTFCGIGAWFVLLCLFVAACAYWFRGGLSHPILKTIGSILILSGLSGLAAFLLADCSGGSLYGPGGCLGATVRYLSLYCFAPLGCYVFLASVCLAGVIFVFDSALLRFFLWITGIFALSEIIISLATPGGGRRRTATETQTKTQTPDTGTPQVEPVPGTAANSTERKTGFIVFEPIGARQTAEIQSAEERTAEEQTDEQSGAEQPTDGEEGAPEYGDDETEPRPYDYVCPDINLLETGETPDYDDMEAKAKSKALEVERAFANYGYKVHVSSIQSGPVLTQYELELPQGTRLNKIRALESDMELALKAASARIIAPLPGRGTVGLEIPNEDRQLVRLHDLMEECPRDIAKMAIPIFLGRDVAGDPLVVDLAKLPHLLIAGRTGTGKSVCLNAIIMSILMCRTPEQIKMILIDPKMVELSLYSSIPHLMHAVVTDMRKAEAILNWAVDQMEERYQLCHRVGVRQLTEYNALSVEQLKRRFAPKSEEEWDAVPRKMPYVVIVADEMADLMMTSGKEVEQHIIRLAQKSRAVGIHLVLATQKPTVDIITGLIKSNLPARIAFGVASRTDSSVVLDCKGAEQLLGNGDMLFLRPSTSHVVRGQGTFISDTEINAVVEEIGTDSPDFEIDIDSLIEKSDREEVAFRKRDSRYEECVETVFQNGKGKASTSMLQRFLGLGYTRAARIIDSMVADGIISEALSNKPSYPRDILISYGQWQERKEEILSSNGPARNGAGQNDPIQNGPDQNDAPRAPSRFESNQFIPVRPEPIVPLTFKPAESRDAAPVGEEASPSPVQRRFPKTVMPAPLAEKEQPATEQPATAESEIAPWEPQSAPEESVSQDDEENAPVEVKHEVVENEPEDEPIGKDEPVEDEDDEEDESDEDDNEDFDDDVDEPGDDADFDDGSDEDEEDPAVEPGRVPWNEEKWNDYLESWEGDGSDDKKEET